MFVLFFFFFFETYDEYITNMLIEEILIIHFAFEKTN